MYSSYSFSTSTLDGMSIQNHSPAALYPGEWTSGTHWTGGWVGPRASLDTEARGKIRLPLPRIELLSPGRPVHSQTLSCLTRVSQRPERPGPLPLSRQLTIIKQDTLNKIRHQNVRRNLNYITNALLASFSAVALISRLN
jgi:hypothetical protein